MKKLGFFQAKIIEKIFFVQKLNIVSDSYAIFECQNLCLGGCIVLLLKHFFEIFSNAKGKPSSLCYTHTQWI